MKFKLFCVFDAKIGAYNRPFAARTNGEAIRMFQSSVKQEASGMKGFEGDYSLFEVGSFDDMNAGFDCPPSPVQIAVATQFVE